MRKTLIFLTTAIVAAVAAGAATPPDTSRAATDYAKAIAGKTPGKPVDCIDTRFSRPSLSAYGDKLIYRVDRKLVYINQTAGGCGGVARGDTLVTRQYQTRLCRGDIAQTVDLPVGMQTGGCALGAFTPWSAP